MVNRRRTTGAGGSLIVVTIVAVLGYTYVPPVTNLVNGVAGWVTDARQPDLPDSGAAGSQLASDVLDALGSHDVAGSSSTSPDVATPGPPSDPSSPPMTDGAADPSHADPAETAVSGSPTAGTDPSAPAARTALLGLDDLPVKGRAPTTGYSRDQFGPAWTDDTTAPLSHNGCDTRNDILQRDLTDIVFKSGHCVVASGELADPYSGTEIAFVRGQDTSGAVQIDHRVALANAWVTGAQQLSPAERADLANDPLELQATSGILNEQKGDGDAATWLPPNMQYRCVYVAAQISIKIKYQLWVTGPEKDAMDAVLATCPDQPLPVTG